MIPSPEDLEASVSPTATIVSEEAHITMADYAEEDDLKAKETSLAEAASTTDTNDSESNPQTGQDVEHDRSADKEGADDQKVDMDIDLPLPDEELEIGKEDDIL